MREELKNVLRFWRARGVEGFRFDVVNLISKGAFEDDADGDGRKYYTDGPHVHEYLKELVHDAGIDGMVTVGEMSSTSIANCIRYSNPAEHELAMTFSFHHLKVDYKDGDKWAFMPPDFGRLKQLFADWQERRRVAAGMRCSGATTTSRASFHALVIRASIGRRRRRCLRRPFISCL